MKIIHSKAVPPPIRTGRPYHARPPRKIGSGKRKGAKAEREIVEFFVDAMRQVEADINSRVNYSDHVRRSGLQWFRGGKDILGAPGISVEVKSRKKLQLDQWWDQCLKQADPGSTSVLIYKLPYRGWRVRSLVYPPTLNGCRGSRPIVADYGLAELRTWYAAFYGEWLSKRQAATP